MSAMKDSNVEFIFFDGGEIDSLIAKVNTLPLAEKVEAINSIKMRLHDISPMKSEPVDCVIWVNGTEVNANDYNPNTVAPPEMELLRVSISEDGYTQPIVTWREDNSLEVIDGFHRNRVGKECKDVRARVHGYLPVVVANSERTDRADRIASTIRHNRARGKHKVEAMSDIVVELKNRNWSNSKISKALGMDEDEILRLCQITGLEDLFSDQQFSKSWDVEGELDESDFEELTDDVDSYGSEAEKFRSVNTSDENRVFHTYDKWECHKAGFYNTTMDGMTKSQCHESYREFLSNHEEFSGALSHVIDEWSHSCEHYLTNIAMNRIAWLGQAAACYARGIPSVFRGGFFLLTEDQQEQANTIALEYLNKWLESRGGEPVDMETALSGGRQSDIY